MTKVELFHARLQTASIANVMPVGLSDDNTSISWHLVHTHGQVNIKFSPADILPNIRVNDFLINHWLANVQVQAGELQFTLDADFAQRYKNKDIQGRKLSLGTDPTAIVLDRNIGIDLHEDLIVQLQQQIDEKSNLNKHTVD